MNSNKLVIQAEQFSAHTGKTLSTIGSYAVRDGKFFARLQDGGDCTTKTVNKVVQWFSDHWPTDLAWPSDLPRPTSKNKDVA